MRSLQPNFSFGGLNTKAQSTGLPIMDCVHLQDMRLVGKDLIQRLGCVRVGQLAGDMEAYQFDGAADFCSSAVDARVWALGLNFTLEVAIQPSTTSGARGILCAGSTTASLILDISGGNIRLRVWDSNPTLTTITVGAAATEVQTIQVTRDGATLSTRLNGGTAVTDTMSATLSLRTPVGDLRIGRDDSTGYFGGTICNPRLYSKTATHNRDRLVLNPTPRGGHVLADYVSLISDATLYADRSRYENNMDATNTPAQVATLCAGRDPVRALSMGRDENGRKQLLVMAGGRCFVAEAS